MSSTIDAYSWMDKAACQGEDDELFYPEAGPQYQSQVDAALAICRRCEVVDACRGDAFQRRDVYGIKGGMTGPERDAILNPPKVPAQRTPVEKKQETPEQAAARARKNERNARSRAKKRDRINAERREARRTEGPYAGMTEEAIDRRRERNREYQARAREEKRAAREAARDATPEEQRLRRLEQHRAKNREWAAKHRAQEKAQREAAWPTILSAEERQLRRERARQWSDNRRAQQAEREAAEREAAELAEEVVVDQAVEEDGLSVA